MHYQNKPAITLVVFALSLLNTPAYAEVQEAYKGLFDEQAVVTPPTKTSPQDPKLEARLNELMDGDFTPSNHAALEELLRTVDVDTPIETFVRAQGYQIVFLAMEQKLPAALAIADEVLIIAEKSGNPNAIAEVHIDIAEAYLATSDFAAALAKTKEIEAWLPDVSNPRVRYHANHVIARTLQQNGQIPAALEYLLAAQTLIPQTDPSEQQRRRQFLNLHLARIQANLGRWQASAETAERTISEALRTGNTNHLADLYLIAAYSRQYQQGPSDEIVAAFLKAAEVGKQLDNPRVEMLAYNNAGAAKLLMEELDEAKRYLEQGLAIAKQIGNVNERSVTEFNLGYIKVLQGQHEQGLQEMLAAAEVFNSFAQKREQAILLSHIAKAYEVAGKYQKQAEILKQQVQMTSELAAAERDQKVNELQVRYQAAEKSYEIKLLEQQADLQTQELAAQQRQQQLFALAAGSLVLLILLFAFGYRKTRKLNALLNEANAELHEQSLRDPLTGLHNRRAIYDQLLRDEKRLYTGNHAVFIIDIDHFKTINDKHGHSVGDEVLIEFGRRVKQAVRKTDMAVRWGGEEFLLVLEHVNAEQVLQVARKLLNDISEKPFHTSAGRLHITLSGGCRVIASNRTPPNWEATVKDVDTLLYQAKSEGRNRIRYQVPGAEPETLVVR
ncbi:GGDEF domain-containing protein [Pseudidiomarina homiensis]|uniref:GGDEF domain-containing protein n=1 Tax=Pseudidiomarina homiensis TaxID=364198 RepID=UPI00215B5D73|nr:GGDEF domain-containing protein [Pseudidiomarina homiensis]